MQNITLITAIAGLVFGFLGAVLGIINTVRAINRDRVRLKVRPVWTFHADGHFVSIEAVNIGYVAVTVAEVVFTLKSKEHSKLTFLPYAGAQLPHRLEARTAVTIYAKPGLEYNAAFKDAKRAYVRTACGCYFTGTSPMLKGIIEKARTAMAHIDEAEQSLKKQN
jgi:hypothetical protein